MAINFTDREEAAAVHLKYKIDKNLDSLSKLGLLTVQEISEHFLKDIYPVEDVEAAVGDAVKTEHLTVYYRVECDQCGKHSIFMEDDHKAKSTWSLIFKEGERCSHCGKKIVGSVRNISRLFAVSTLKLTISNEEPAKDKTTFERFISWLLPKRNRK
jgi:hypothetical protein